MQCFLHQTHQTIGDFEQIFHYLEELSSDGELPSGIHLFPELFLCGYPLQDLCLQKDWIHRYTKHIERIDAWLEKLPTNSESLILVGGLDYEFDESGLPLNIRNVIFQLKPGKGHEVQYVKQLLPNYDIFEEKKYFTGGNSPKILEWNGLNIGLLICEDMWSSTTHHKDPVLELKKWSDSSHMPLDFVVNLSASPFFLGKPIKRFERAKQVSHLLKAPFAYVNRVGGEDEILFDGGSFALNGDDIIIGGNSFETDLLDFQVPKKLNQYNEMPIKVENTWESLFNPNLITQAKTAHIPKLSDTDCENLFQSISFGLQEYIGKCGFKKMTVALSGGMDSALVMAIAKLCLKPGQSLDCIYMPGLYSRPESFDLSLELCENLGIKLVTLPIKFLHSAVNNAYKDNFGENLEGLADENIQSRLRGALIMAHSNQVGSVVLNTSNKSELAVGYSTLYGDSIGAISLLGDLYKTEVFELAKYLNKKLLKDYPKGFIPTGIITRAPSAELRADQEDSHSLPPYEILDGILEGILSYRLTLENLLDLGFKKTDIDLVYGLYKKSEYKRSQFCSIIKVKAKSFGFGYRVPITEWK